MHVKDEQPILLRELARILPSRPNYDTVLKWCRRGLVYDRGEKKKRRIKMEAVRLTNGLGSSMQAYSRFINRLNGMDGEG
jgi:hypothetical protein